MRCVVFTDPIYHGDKYVEFDPADVMAMEEKTVSLLLRGKHPVTYITLKSGAEYPLKGHLRAQIEAAQREVKS